MSELENMLVTPESQSRHRSQACQILKPIQRFWGVIIDWDKPHDHLNIWIRHKNKYTPDFHLKWDPKYDYYRVYIHVGSTTYDKSLAGYTIAVIKNQMSAIDFVNFYRYISENKSNQSK